MKTVSFAISKADHRLLMECVYRAQAIVRERGIDYPQTDMMMDLSACHANGCPLDFKKLLGFPAFDFSHDIFGIFRCLNRRTGQLEHCFLPRSAARVLAEIGKEK